jgi:hypothetical protein
LEGNRKPTEAAAQRTTSVPTVQKALIMRSNSPKFSRRITDVLDEIIPTMPVDDGMSALIARIRPCILKAATEEQASYEALLAAASAEISMISKERSKKARPSPRKDDSGMPADPTFV